MSIADPGEILVDPAWIAAHLDDPQVHLVEVNVPPAAYAEGHILASHAWFGLTQLLGYPEVRVHYASWAV